MKPLVIITARGGSKRLPGKNIKPLLGKPLILHSVDVARAVFPDEAILVSTDDPEIRRVVEESGLPVPFLRPEELATDTASSHDVMVHALSFAQARGYDADTVVLLQPTSPLRTATHLREALALYDESLDMVVSVKETKADPFALLREGDATGMLHRMAPQRPPAHPLYQLNGALYIINGRSLMAGPSYTSGRVRGYVMQEQDSVDVDTELDWLLAEELLKRRQGAPVL